jgi:ATP-dependent Clp protease ATP-binding subunit ClpC
MTRTFDSLAREEAIALSCEAIGTEHLLLAILREGGAGQALLVGMGIDPVRVRTETEALFAGRPRKAVSGDFPFSPRAKNALEAAVTTAVQLDRPIGSDHLLAGLLTEPEGGASKVLTALGLTHEAVMARLRAPGFRPPAL